MKTAVTHLIELIPSGSEIKNAIFENDMDEKMLDEWLWERLFKDNDWIAKEKEQIIDVFMHFYCDDPIRKEDAEDYYNSTFNPKTEA